MTNDFHSNDFHGNDLHGNDLQGNNLHGNDPEPNNGDSSLPTLSLLLQERLAVVGALAESLERSRPAFRQKDAEAIARGAAHQAELCRQWSRLEAALRARGMRSDRDRRRSAAERGKRPAAETLGNEIVGNEAAAIEHMAIEDSARLAVEWDALSARVGYLTRVHCSLLRHMERSLTVLNRMIVSCSTTYSPEASAVTSSLETSRLTGD